jgi:hypothetical protein
MIRPVTRVSHRIGISCTRSAVRELAIRRSRTASQQHHRISAVVSPDHSKRPRESGPALLLSHFAAFAPKSVHGSEAAAANGYAKNIFVPPLAREALLDNAQW